MKEDSSVSVLSLMRKSAVLNRLISLECAGFIGRGERIRTSGPCLPKAVLYQAELHPDLIKNAAESIR